MLWASAKAVSIDRYQLAIQIIWLKFWRFWFRVRNRSLDWDTMNKWDDLGILSFPQSPQANGRIVAQTRA